MEKIRHLIELGGVLGGFGCPRCAGFGVPTIFLWISLPSTPVKTAPQRSNAQKYYIFFLEKVNTGGLEPSVSYRPHVAEGVLGR